MIYKIIKTATVSFALGIAAHASAQEIHHTSSVEQDPASPFHYIETRCEITRHHDYDDVFCVKERLHMHQTSGEGTIISQTRGRDDTYAQIRNRQEEAAARLEAYANTNPPPGKYRILTQGNIFIVIDSEGNRVESTYDDLPLHIPYSRADQMCSGTFCVDDNENVTALNSYAFSHTEHYQNLNPVIDEAEIRDGYYRTSCPTISSDPCTVSLVNGNSAMVHRSDLPQYLPMAPEGAECEKTFGGGPSPIPGPFCYGEGEVGYTDRVLGLNPEYNFN